MVVTCNLYLKTGSSILQQNNTVMSVARCLLRNVRGPQNSIYDNSFTNLLYLLFKIILIINKRKSCKFLVSLMCSKSKSSQVS
jgi:hypothetical protein